MCVWCVDFVLVTKEYCWWETSADVVALAYALAYTAYNYRLLYYYERKQQCVQCTPTEERDCRIVCVIIVAVPVHPCSHALRYSFRCDCMRCVFGFQSGFCCFQFLYLLVIARPNAAFMGNDKYRLWKNNQARIAMYPLASAVHQKWFETYFPSSHNAY